MESQSMEKQPAEIQPAEMQPAERVTAVRRKDPKRVAAGKAGYAARKEREAKKLEALQNHKHSLKETKAEPISSEPERPKPEQTLNGQTLVAPVVLCLGIGAAIFWFVLQKGQKPETSILKTSEPDIIYDPFEL